MAKMTELERETFIGDERNAERRWEEVPQAAQVGDQDAGQASAEWSQRGQ